MSLSVLMITLGTIHVRTNPRGRYAGSMHIIINVINSPVNGKKKKKNRKVVGRVDRFQFHDLWRMCSASRNTNDTKGKYAVIRSVT